MKVSVVINCFNYARYVGAAIDSALAQSHQPCEVVVVDDGSTDTSWEVLQAYGTRVQALRQANAGQGAAYNAGFAACTGEWVLFLDADDMLDPQAVQKCLAAAGPHTAKVQFLLRTIGPEGRPLGGVVPYLMHQGDVSAIVQRYGSYAGPPASGNLYRRTAIERYLPMPAAAWRRAADTVPFVLSSLHGQVCTLHEVLGSYRLHTPANARQGIVGNVSRSLREAVFQPHRSRVALSAWAAQRSGLHFHEPLLVQPADWRLRVLAWRLQRSDYPFPADTRRLLWRGACRSLRHWPGYTATERLLQFTWLAFVLCAPVRWLPFAAASQSSGLLRAQLKRRRDAEAA